ncbi:hypothetical protein CPC08DRAFT_425200 [Agrocybe pediades]|nr:hypothetical protein CPC08DRAFT_425200 [Agrocybe pediades]
MPYEDGEQPPTYIPNLPPDLEAWMYEPSIDFEVTAKGMAATTQKWETLRTFFTHKGYTLYTPEGRTLNQKPPTTLDRARDDLFVFPYARKFVDKEDDFLFRCNSPYVRAARDALGREVVIKLVSDGKKTTELDFLKFLNTKKARADPRNHTIPVIEFITLEKYAFVVMPRWSNPCYPLGFDTVEEVLNFARIFFEAFAFLHDNRIAHFDFLEQNAAVNALYTSSRARQGTIPGLRDPASVRYALIDFSCSSMYPLDVPLDDARDTREVRSGMIAIRDPVVEPYNPFAVDFHSCADIIEQWTRHIENIVPDLGPFFDKITTINYKRGSQASEALQSFMEIYSKLSPSTLRQEIGTWRWRSGTSEPKPWLTNS